MSEPIKVDFSKKSDRGRPARTREIIIPPDRAVIKLIVTLVLSALFGGVLYYFMLPPMNFQSTDFYVFWASVLGFYIALTVLMSGAAIKREYVPYVKRRAVIPIVLALILGAVLLVGFMFSNVFFRAKRFSELIAVDEAKDLNSSVTVINSTKDFVNVPMIDAAASERLADKVLGDLASIGLESQFDLATQYSTQINYKGAPSRVYPLRYGNIFKWINNTRNGFPGYVIVNMNTQETHFCFVKGGGVENYIKYSPAEHFSKFLKRVVRFKYPTKILGDISFEVDDSGNPFWICEDIKMRVGLIGGRDVRGIVLVNAVTGEMEYFTSKELKDGKSAGGKDLQWIDRVYDIDLLVEQYNYFGMYKNGFWNSVFGQTGVKSTTRGASYLAINDDVYAYTGVTSVSSDESILGFIMINQRTKDAKFYSITGATEEAAMNSANGALSDKGWQATFPLLINLDGEATYFMAMKDSTNVVKSYAMVNVSNYNIVATDTADGDPDLNKCIDNYKGVLKDKKNKTISIDTSAVLPKNPPVGQGEPSSKEPATRVTASGVVAEIRKQNEKGETCYYVKFAGGNSWFKINSGDIPEAVFWNVGDKIEFECETGGEHWTSVEKASSVS